MKADVGNRDSKRPLRRATPCFVACERKRPLGCRFLISRLFIAFHDFSDHGWFYVCGTLIYMTYILQGFLAQAQLQILLALLESWRLGLKAEVSSRKLRRMSLGCFVLR